MPDCRAIQKKIYFLTFFLGVPYHWIMNPGKVIDRLGGTTAVAKICEIEPASVSEWRHNGIPKARLMYLRVVYPKAFVGERAVSKKPK